MTKQQQTEDYPSSDAACAAGCHEWLTEDALFGEVDCNNCAATRRQTTAKQ